MDADFAAMKGKLTKALADFKAVGTRQETGILQTKLDTVVSAGEAKQFQEADTLGKQLMAELQNGSEGRKKLSDEWEKRQGEAKDLVKKIGKLQSSKCLAVKERAMMMMNLVVPHEIKRLSEEGEWGLLVDGLNKAAKGIVELEALDQNFTRFRLKADAADTKVQTSITATEKRSRTSGRGDKSGESDGRAAISRRNGF